MSELLYEAYERNGHTYYRSKASDSSPVIDSSFYIAGPMTGLPECNFPAFHKVAETLRESGYNVVNPAELDEGKTDKTWDYFMRRDLALLCRCTHVVVLPGWERSRGARLEVRTARSLGLTICDPALMPVETRGIDLSDSTCPNPDYDPFPFEVAGDESITEEAERLVSGARNGDYGHPADDFDALGRMWGAMLTRWWNTFGNNTIVPAIPGEIVGLMMVALKLNRQVHVLKRDNLVDSVGYLKCVERIGRRRDGLE